jgi:hypothetical protein
MFFSSFILANFLLYRRLAQDISYQADMRLAILEKDFSHSYGSRRSPFREVQTNLYGFSKQGVPDWGSLWANIRIANAGYEQGQLAWEYDESKTKLPSLFASDKVNIEFCPPLSVAGRSSSSAHFFFDVLFAEQDPCAFAQALGGLVKSKQRYEVILRYRTSRIDSESKARELRIEGDFQGFYQKVLKYWDEHGFKDLVSLAQIG